MGPQDTRQTPLLNLYYDPHTTDYYIYRAVFGGYRLAAKSHQDSGACAS